MDTYANLPADFVDAGLLEVAEAKNVKNIITIDRDFDAIVYQKANG